ncbi:hypothetical protein FB451DRAFT_1487158 [Mycena latifolia]|nr:hypothetical protein FB451DRAFT_1487158 [Mycena latifolia]
MAPSNRSAGSGARKSGAGGRGAGVILCAARGEYKVMKGQGNQANWILGDTLAAETAGRYKSSRVKYNIPPAREQAGATELGAKRGGARSREGVWGQVRHPQTRRNDRKMNSPSGRCWGEQGCTNGDSKSHQSQSRRASRGRKSGPRSAQWRGRVGWVGQGASGVDAGPWGGENDGVAGGKEEARDHNSNALRADLDPPGPVPVPDLCPSFYLFPARKRYTVLPRADVCRGPSRSRQLLGPAPAIHNRRR